MKNRTAIFVILILSLAHSAFADTMLDIYNQFKEEPALDATEATAPLENFHAAVGSFMNTQEFSVMSVQQSEMADLVSKMQTAGTGAQIDSLMISYLEQSRTVLLKNQRYILFVSLLLSALIILVSAAVFYIIMVSEKKRIAKEILLELERERTRISFELHDTVAQEITSASLILKSAEKTDGEKSNGSPMDETLTEAQNLLENAQKEIRGILSALNPPALEESSVETLMRELCASFQKSSGVECSLNVAEDFSSLTFTADEKLNIFRIVQEALTNIQKHANATSVQVIFRLNGGGKKGYVFFVCDDGLGFNVNNGFRKKNFGLKSIEQRVSFLGGTLKILSGEQTGTTIRVEVAK